MEMIWELIGVRKRSKVILYQELLLFVKSPFRFLVYWIPIATIIKVLKQSLSSKIGSSLIDEISFKLI